MTKIVLIGTCHPIQLDHERTDFVEYLQKLISQYCVGAIAEEIDASSVSSKIADELKLTYLVIEPNPEERQALGIQNIDEINYSIFYDYDDEKSSEAKTECEARKQKAYRAREQEWLNRINKLSISPVLVICGANHFEPFASLLANNGYEVIKECALWE